MKQLGKAVVAFMFLASIAVTVTGCVDGDSAAKDEITSMLDGKKGGCFYYGRPCSNKQDW